MTGIRPARLGDLDALVELLRALFSIEADFRPDAVRQRRALSLLLEDPRSRVLVADRDGEVVGMASVQLVVSTAEGGLAALVEDVVVDEAARGTGVGSQLVEACERWARSHGSTRLQLLADRENAPALRFYSRLGWNATRLVCLRRGGVR